MGLVAERVTDRKVLRLVRGFLRAGIVEQHGGFAASLTERWGQIRVLQPRRGFHVPHE